MFKSGQFVKLDLENYAYDVATTHTEKTRRERLKSALYLRLKMRKRLFLKKNLKFLIFFQKMSHSAEKCERGALWALLTYILLQNIKKLERGLFWDIKKFSKKVAQCRKKSNLLVSSGFVGYGKKSKKWKEGPFCSNFRWPDLASYASSFSSFDCKKSGPIRVRL